VSLALNLYFPMVAAFSKAMPYIPRAACAAFLAKSFQAKQLTRRASTCKAA
jgi:hypothetical protein